MAAPVAGIGWSAVYSPVKVGDTVTFSDLSTNSPDYWEWDFDNNGTVDSYLQNPTFKYGAPGIYSVKLFVSNVDGDNTLVLTSEITVVANNSPPLTDFTFAPSTVPVGQTVNFYDNSQNTPTSWSWNLGNGQTTTFQNTNTTYASAGSYAVRLTATNAAGSNTVAKTVIVTAANVAPVASINASVTNGVAPLTVTFTDGSTGSPTQWAWDFTSNGTIDSTDRNPASQTYSSAGVYTAKLKVSNAQGESTAVRTITVTSAAGITPDFTATPLSGAVPLAVTFTDASTSANPLTVWRWDFNNDGIIEQSTQGPHTYTYTRAGKFSVRLTAGTSSNEETVIKNLLIDALPAGSGAGGTLTLTQGSNSASTSFIKGTVATFYDTEHNNIRYGVVSAVTYLSNPTFKILHKAFYVPRVNPIKTDAENYADRKGLICLAENTIATSTLVSTAFTNQGVAYNDIPTVGSAQVSVNSGAVTSIYSVGTLVSALITSSNVIVLGRISSIRYINSDAAGTPSTGYFLYYIKSWAKGPRGPVLRTYTTKETNVRSISVSLNTLVSIGKIPLLPKNNLVIKPTGISGGGTSGNNTTDLLPKTYNVQLTATGGTAPYFFDIIDGVIMTGCNLSVGGLISGTATAPGTFIFTVRCTDSNTDNPGEGFRTYQVTLGEATDTPLYGGSDGGGY